MNADEQNLLAEAETAGRDVDVGFAWLLLRWLPDWRRGQTWSTTVARLATDTATTCRLCRWFGVVCCWWLSIAVQKNHCALCLDPNAPPFSVSVYERAGVCFLVLAIILIALAAGALWLVTCAVWGLAS